MSEASDGNGNGLQAAGQPKPKVGKPDAAAARRERQAAQLRANLARRKQQARERARLSSGLDGPDRAAEAGDPAET